MSSILIIDDNELVSQMLQESLSSHGYNVMQAHDANSGYKLAQQQKPDLILLDIVLPDIDGVQLCKMLRSNRATSQIRIILITGTASSTPEKVRGLQAGADDYVIKPFEMDELIERIRAVLRRPAGQASSPTAISATPIDRSAESVPPVFSFSPRAPRAERSLVFLMLMTAFLAAGLAFAPAARISTFNACLLVSAVWAVLVSALVVGASLAGIALKWKDGATLLSIAGTPILIKFACAAFFSFWTSLSPFEFTASPVLFLSTAANWMARLDLFDLWTVGSLAVLLKNRPGGSAPKSICVALGVWALAALLLSARSLLGR